MGLVNGFFFIGIGDLPYAGSNERARRERVDIADYLVVDV